MKTPKPTNPNNLAECDAWFEEIKAAHPGKEVYLITVPRNIPKSVDEHVEYAKCAIRKMQRSELEAVMGLQQQRMMLTASETILNTCWVAGDEEIKTDDDLFLGAHTAMAGMVTMRLGLLKKS